MFTLKDHPKDSLSFIGGIGRVFSSDSSSAKTQADSSLPGGERSPKRVAEGRASTTKRMRQRVALSGPICKSVPGCWILINVLVTRKRAGDAII
ncbi:hypothetical protein ANTQUA_LOCUS1410 [Anthophora quadrimaculata]